MLFPSPGIQTSTQAYDFARGLIGRAGGLKERRGSDENVHLSESIALETEINGNVWGLFATASPAEEKKKKGGGWGWVEDCSLPCSHVLTAL